MSSFRPLPLLLPQAVQEQLSVRNESLLEKEVVFDEVARLTEDLRSTAAAEREKGLAVAQSASSYRKQLRKVTRRLMATISELSLYQVS